MTYTFEQRTDQLRSRGLVFGFILLGHVGFFWMLNAGLVSGSQIVDKIFKVVAVVEPAPEERVVEPPPPPPNRIEVETPDVKAPVIDVVEATGAEGPGAIYEERRPFDPPVIIEVAKKIVLPTANPRRPLTQPPYPPASVRLNEEGTVTLELYVLENGRVGEATVFKSSGYPRLDQAAVEEAKRAWRLLPGTEDGQPKAMRYQFAVKFRLNQ